MFKTWINNPGKNNPDEAILYIHMTSPLPKCINSLCNFNHQEQLVGRIISSFNIYCKLSLQIFNTVHKTLKLEKNYVRIIKVTIPDF